jgi:hypothetical protein
MMGAVAGELAGIAADLARIMDRVLKVLEAR